MARDPNRVQVINWGRHRIRLMPGWGATFRHDTQEADRRARKASGRGPAELKSVRQPPHTPDGKILDAADGPTFAVALSGEFDLYHEGIDSAEGAARAVVAGMLAASFHEAVEWVTVDGRRVADPHPYGDTQWEWVMDAMLGLVADYARKWPTSDLSVEANDG